MFPSLDTERAVDVTDLAMCAQRCGASIGSLFLPFLGALVALLALLSPSRGHAADPRQLTIHVTDRGIDQMRHWQNEREDGLTWIRGHLPEQARIALLMPKGVAIEPSGIEQLKARFVKEITERVDAALKAGMTEVEIQLVEDVSRIGYFAPWRQDALDRFGAAAYGAIGELNTRLGQGGVKVASRANLGSNGTKVFANNVDAWSPKGKAIWESVDMFDGRAFMVPMVKVIDRIGFSRVRLFNTKGDWLAPNLGFAYRSIGNSATSIQLRDHYFPLLKVYMLNALGGIGGHISGMDDANRFLIEEYRGRIERYQPLRGTFFGRELRRPAQLPSAVSRAVPSQDIEGIAVWRTRAQDLVTTLQSFGDGFETLYGQGNKGSQSILGLGRGAGLAQAIAEDIELAGESELVSLKSRTVEALVKLIFDWTARTPDGARIPGAEGYKELYGGLMEVARTGRVDVETMKSFDRATLEFAKPRIEASYAAKLEQHRSKVASLEREHAQAAANVGRKDSAANWRSGDRSRDLAREHELRAANRALEQVDAKLKIARHDQHLAQIRVTRNLLLLDALPELAAAVAEHARKGTFTVEVADRYSDALLTISASLVAATLATNPVTVAYAPAIRDGLVAAGHYLRDDLLVQPIQNMHNFLAGDKWKVLELYQTYQRRAVHDGAAINPFSQLFGKADLQTIGFSAEEIAQLDDQARLLNRTTRQPGPSPRDRQTAALPAPSHASPTESRQSLRSTPESTPAKAVQLERRQADPLGTTHSATPLLLQGPCSSTSGTCGGVDLGLTALVIDPDTRRMAVVGELGTSVTWDADPALIALALWLEYTNQSGAFSLDPFDRLNPRGEWLRAVYFPEGLRGTKVGNDCFDADFLLKQFSLGVRVEGQRIVERVSASGLSSLPKLISGQSGMAERWSRMWIVSRSVRVRTGDGIARVEKAEMGVEARQQVPDPSTRSGLRDVASPGNSNEQQFARQFESLYDQIAATEAPSLNNVREAIKAIALARWLKMNGVPVDIQAVVDHLNSHRTAAVDKVNALSVNWSSQTQAPFSEGNRSGVRTTTTTVNVFGGVDLRVQPSFTQTAQDMELRNATLRWLRSPGNAQAAEIVVAGRRFRAMALPFGLAPGMSGKR